MNGRCRLGMQKGASTALTAVLLSLWAAGGHAAPATTAKAPAGPVEPPLTLENARPTVVPPRPGIKTPKTPSAPPPLFTPDSLDVPDPAKVEALPALPAPAATPGLPPVPPKDKRPAPVASSVGVAVTPSPVPHTTTGLPVQPALPPAPPSASSSPTTAAVRVPLPLPSRPWLVTFSPGSSALPQDAMSLLSTLADEMIASPNRRLRLMAYAPGDADHQREARQLSLARALAVREKLNGLGIRATRIDLHPLGAAVPADATSTPDLVKLEWATE